MTKMTFTRTLTIEPDSVAGLTLAALEGLVRNARRMSFADDARVYVMPGGRIGVTEH